MAFKGKYPKKYGQVFLRDRNIAVLEARSLNLGPGSTVLEIGPGDGILTEALLQTGYSVTAVESDHRFAEILLSRFSDYVSREMLTVVKGDFLRYGPGNFDGIAGNIPYHISSQIIFHLDAFRFRTAVLMVQMEFGKRLIAVPGTKDYSRLGVNAQIRYNIHAIRKVSRRSFSPIPEVDSLVISLIPKPDVSLDKVMRADQIFRILFSQRRKKIGTLFPTCPEKYMEKRCGDLSPAELYELATAVSG